MKIKNQISLLTGKNLVDNRLSAGNLDIRAQITNRQLELIANKVRKDIVKMIAAAGSGHPGGSLSCADIITALYFKIMKLIPEKPCWQGRDYFILSKGHAAAALYSAMARRGYFDKKELMTYRKLGSRLQGHPAKPYMKGIDASSGSLGQGLSVGIGIALALKLDKKPNRVYCMLGDGELNEGQIWESAMTASHHKLNNIVAIVDNNGLQLSDKTENIKDLNSICEKWWSFGWYVINIDGNNMKEIIDGFQRAQDVKHKPCVIIAKTIKGKGISFMENDPKMHGKSLSQIELKKALIELNKNETKT
ncbi:MAG: 1-deoxy-D-xylulose-5-phosphate synthase [Candidatus Woesearchaeota archaeon]|nr:1-deoxy-D-xylulose-5-phosphate synthase [Candidatus Woesearchaeota archaeon]